MIMSEQAKQKLLELIQGGETLTVEFKGDWSGNKMAPNNPGLSDKDLTEALIALANTEGGFLLLGVEVASYRRCFSCCPAILGLLYCHEFWFQRVLYPFVMLHLKTLRSFRDS